MHLMDGISHGLKEFVVIISRLCARLHGSAVITVTVVIVTKAVGSGLGINLRFGFGFGNGHLACDMTSGIGVSCGLAFGTGKGLSLSLSFGHFKCSPGWVMSASHLAYSGFQHMRGRARWERQCLVNIVCPLNL
jgi:hypothetical protein